MPDPPFMTFLERIREVVAEGHGICYDEELFLSDLRGGATFWDLFSPGAELQLDHEDCERAVSRVQRDAKVA